MVQLNAYILDLDFDESDIEFQFIEYGSRSEARRIENYAVLDQESQAFQLRNIDLESKKSFYVVSFKEEDSELKILPS
ncbi:MAG: hypothetical protein FWG98_15340, partial [Candidatus Cloacimonetes bacterium]|nr:hypothetical protein [Candidatus Cloacimonadota bacterium]